MNIYEQQARNKRLTFLIFLVFFALLMAIGLGFDYFYLNTINTSSVELKMNADGYYEPVKKGASFFPIGTISALIISAVMGINSSLNGHNIVIRSTKARIAFESDPKEKQFLNVIKEMSIAAGLPVPTGYIVPDDDLNAFTTGLSPEKSYIAITQGLLDKLNREELQAVVAHEMSHIKNYDMRLMTIAAVLMNSIALLSDWVVRSSVRGSVNVSGSSGKKGKGVVGPLFIFWIVLIILAPILSRIMAMAISRQREYLADASAAELTRNPLSLISALEKIRNAVEPTYSINNGIAHMCITDPRGSLLEEREGFLADLLATHPPMEKRILALKIIAYQMNNR
jgi:heat shock protein HtpX